MLAGGYTLKCSIFGGGKLLMEDFRLALWQQDCAALWQDRFSVRKEGDQGVSPHFCTSPEVVSPPLWGEVM